MIAVSASGAGGFDLPVRSAPSKRERPGPRLHVRLAIADLGDVAGRAAARRGGFRLAVQRDVADVEVQGLRGETIERARERALVDGRPYGTRGARVEAFIRRAVAL